MFETAIYAERRKKLQQIIGSGILLFLGNRESSINYVDNCYRFRQDSSFLYFFGISRPNLCAIIDIDNGRSILFGTEFTMDDIIWSGPQPSLSGLAERAGIDNVKDLSKLPDFLDDVSKNNINIHYLPPYRPEHYQQMASLLGKDLVAVEKYFSKVFTRAVITLRSIKSEEEIIELNKAGNITANMHLEVMKAARPGMIEAELAGIAQKEAISGGGDLSFPTILTKNGQTLHNHFHGNTLQEGDLVLVDCGAETAMGYAGDMTRTFPVGKKFTSRQRDIYNIVLNAQTTAATALCPNVPYIEIHQLAGKKISEGLKDLGLMQGNVENAVAIGAYALFMPHGIGHMTGLDVHDMENLGEDLVGYDKEVRRSDMFGVRSLRLGKKLKPGYTLTIEPGIYFVPDLIRKWRAENKSAEFINYSKVEEYLNFGGIRIEEDYHITETGGDLLGKPLAKSINEIEEIRQTTLEQWK